MLPVAMSGSTVTSVLRSAHPNISCLQHPGGHWASLSFCEWRSPVVPVVSCAATLSWELDPFSLGKSQP